VVASQIPIRKRQIRLQNRQILLSTRGPSGSSHAALVLEPLEWRRIKQACPNPMKNTSRTQIKIESQVLATGVIEEALQTT
jgi:hypothetical protein